MYWFDVKQSLLISSKLRLRERERRSYVYEEEEEDDAAPDEKVKVECEAIERRAIIKSDRIKMVDRRRCAAFYGHDIVVRSFPLQKSGDAGSPCKII